jgi:hypothetical protein
MILCKIVLAQKSNSDLVLFKELKNQLTNLMMFFPAGLVSDLDLRSCTETSTFPSDKFVCDRHWQGILVMRDQKSLSRHVMTWRATKLNGI